MAEDGSVIEALKALALKKAQKDHPVAEASIQGDEKRLSLMKAIDEERIWDEAEDKRSMRHNERRFSLLGQEIEDCEDMEVPDDWNVLDLSSWQGKKDYYAVLTEMRQGTRGPVAHFRSLGFSPLHMAAMLGSSSLFWWMVNHDEDVTCRTSGGNSVLHVMSEYGWTDLMNSTMRRFSAGGDLFTFPASSTASSSSSSSSCVPSSLQVSSPSEERYLSPRSRNHCGQTCLHLASTHGHLEVVRLIVKADQRSMNDEDLDNMTPFACAASRGQLEVVKWMVEQAPTSASASASASASSTTTTTTTTTTTEPLLDINITSLKQLLSSRARFSFTPLLSAALHGHIEVVKFLVEQVILKKENKTTKKSCSTSSSSEPQSKLTSDDDEEEEQEEQEEDKEDYNYRGLLSDSTNLGNTMLHVACMSGHIPLVKYLLHLHLHFPKPKPKPFFQLDAKNGNGQTALHLAAWAGHAKLCWALASLDPNLLKAKNAKGNSPFLMACLKGHLMAAKEMVRASLERNAGGSSKEEEKTKKKEEEEEEKDDDDEKKNVENDVKKEKQLEKDSNISGAGGTGADLVLDKSASSTSIVPLPLASSPLFLDINNNGNNALHLAAYGGHPDVMEWLLKSCPSSSVSLSTPSNNGNTPLFHACAQGHYETVKYLLVHHMESAWGDRERRNKAGSTALDLARPFPHIQALLSSSI